MTQLEEMLDNVFVEPEEYSPPSKKEKLVANYRKRYQLLDFDDVINLSEVMEKTVPVDGKGNFPSLEVTPSTLVQMVRDGLTKEGIRVPNVRLNGSAATHVLSADGKHSYKDLDLIFAVDMSQYNEFCTCGSSPIDLNNNATINNTYCRTKAHKTSSKRHPASQKSDLRTAESNSVSENGTINEIQVSNEDLSFVATDDTLDSELSGSKTPDSSDSSPCSNSPATVQDKADFEVDLEDCADKDSGYTSSGSSVASLPVSPAGSWSYQNAIRSRTHSLDSSSSITSTSSSGQHVLRNKENGHYLDVHASARNTPVRKLFSKAHAHQECCVRSKELCWRKIKDVVIGILRDLLPARVNKTRMTDAVLADAYVQKMVKITNDVDRWSLFSLNNNDGRNLELKFVENMRRQYEFSVDSFQIILDSYQRFKIVSKNLEESEDIKISPNFYPSVLAESVYGDFEAALRHLRHRRICTKRPEEIRGGGLLRYCNLLVRDFTAGEVEGYERDTDDDTSLNTTLSSASTDKSNVTSHSYSTSSAEDVSRLERLMCSRFFIDFSEFPRQQQKLLSYLESHFACEDELKFQYLLIVRKVVDNSTVCLMSNERGQIIDFVTKLATEALAKSVQSGNQYNSCHSNQSKSGSRSALVPQPYVPYHGPIQGQQYQVMDNNQLYQNQPQCYQSQTWNHNNNNCNSNNYFPVYAPSTVPPQINYASPNFYPHSEPQSKFYPQYDYNQIPQQVPVALCPCCRSTYPQVPIATPQVCCENSTNQNNPQVVITPPRHTMSVDSLPFYPASKDPSKTQPSTSTTTFSGPRSELVYLPKNAKLFYSAGPIATTQASSNDTESTSHSAENQINPVESGNSLHSETTET
uniref:uncharacterized protein LOC120337241 n=1 Tax=Styela clava TaxID=7725 RepID=UPI00193A405B|nr:uncharacterized protein LOC120337241 [Styela clava]